jgi:hypothetical protein
MAMNPSSSCTQRLEVDADASGAVSAMDVIGAPRSFEKFSPQKKQKVGHSTQRSIQEINLSRRCLFDWLVVCALIGPPKLAAKNVPNPEDGAFWAQFW